MFTAPGMLALADLLPIMTAYVDRDEVVRFLNKPLAECLEQPRGALLGRVAARHDGRGHLRATASR